MKLLYRVSVGVLLCSLACSDTKPTQETKIIVTKGEREEKAPQIISKKIDREKTPLYKVNRKANVLWNLAPKNTTIGAVLQRSSGQKLQSKLLEFFRIVQQRPLGQAFFDQALHDAKEWPFNVFNTKEFKKAGIDLTLPSAVFFKTLQTPPYFILPVSDTKAFLKWAKGKRTTKRRKHYDKYSSNIVCTTKSKRYICAPNRKALDSFGRPVRGTLAKKVSTLSSQYRGDLEIVANIGQLQNNAEDSTWSHFLSSMKLGVISLRLEENNITAHAWLEGTPSANMMDWTPSMSNKLVKNISSKNIASLLYLRFPLESISSEIANDMQWKDFSIKKDVLQNMSGEFIFKTPSRSTFGHTLSIGLKHADTWKALLTKVCNHTKTVDGVEAIQKNNECVFTIHPYNLLNLDEKTLEAVKSIVPKTFSLTASIIEEKIELSIGNTKSNVTNTNDEYPKALLKDSWNVSFWDQNSGFLSNLTNISLPVLKQKPSKIQEVLDMLIWVYAHVYEVSFGAGMRDNGLHISFQFRSYASDPIETYQVLEKTIIKAMQGNNIEKDLINIREKWPKSMAGQPNNGNGGTMTLTLASLLYWALLGSPNN